MVVCLCSSFFVKTEDSCGAASERTIERCGSRYELVRREGLVFDAIARNDVDDDDGYSFWNGGLCKGWPSLPQLRIMLMKYR